MSWIRFIALLVLVFGFSSCQSSQNTEMPGLPANANPSGGDGGNGQSGKVKQVVVNEVIQVAKYTYLRVTEAGHSAWMAVPTIEAGVGDTLYYEGGMLMTNFESRELKRTFDNILFVDKVSKDAAIAAMPRETILAHQKMVADSNSADREYPGMGSSKDTVKQAVKVEKVANAIPLSDLLKNPKKFEGKKVIVHGKITKFTPEVMGKNWIHLQDGTDHNGKFEIVITTSDKASKDETVTFEGVISLNKDLGYGYFFEMLMEDARRR